MLDRIVTDGDDYPFNQSIAGERKRVDLDGDTLSFADKSDVLVRHKRFDLQRLLPRHNHEQRLTGLDDAADGMNRKLLHFTGHWRREYLQGRNLRRLDVLLSKPRHFLFELFHPRQRVVSRFRLERALLLHKLLDGGLRRE